jgi:hypothetical protein
MALVLTGILTRNLKRFGMKRYTDNGHGKQILAVSMAVVFLVSACGGGDDGGATTTLSASTTPVTSAPVPPPASVPAPIPVPVPAPVPALTPALLVQPASRVNTTTAGEQTFASVSAQADGGYTVAWIDNNNTGFAIQRYDSAGSKVGTEVSVPFSRLATTGVITDIKVAVLRDASVVLVYETSRRLDTGQPVEGVFFQRFDASGAQLSGETTVVSHIGFNGPVYYGQSGGSPKAVPLADGGFVVAWAIYAINPISVSNTVFKQRYNSQAQPVGGNVWVSSYRAPYFGAYALAADRQGGYILTMLRSINPMENNPGTSVIHFDAADTAREIVPERLGSALLLPLAGDRFVRFTSDSTGTLRQFLDSAGNPVGDAASAASMPVAATELADGSFVVFTPASGGSFTAQRFNANGAALGDAAAVDASTAAALTGGSLALARSATLPGCDFDVYTQRVLVRN